MDSKIWDVDKLRTIMSNEEIIQKALGISLPYFSIENSFCGAISGQETLAQNQQAG